MTVHASVLFALAESQTRRLFPYAYPYVYVSFYQDTLGVGAIYELHGNVCKTRTLISWEDLEKLAERRHAA